MLKNAFGKRQRRFFYAQAFWPVKTIAKKTVELGGNPA